MYMVVVVVVKNVEAFPTFPTLCSITMN